jgi:hypothetical protein
MKLTVSETERLVRLLRDLDKYFLRISPDIALRYEVRSLLISLVGEDHVR